MASNDRGPERLAPVRAKSSRWYKFFLGVTLA